MVAIRKILIIRAANQAMAFSIPTLAAVLSFVTYGATRDNLDPVRMMTRESSFETPLLTMSGCHFHVACVIQSPPAASYVSAKSALDLDGRSDRREEA